LSGLWRLAGLLILHLLLLALQFLQKLFGRLGSARLPVVVLLVLIGLFGLIVWRVGFFGAIVARLPDLGWSSGHHGRLREAALGTAGKIGRGSCRVRTAGPRRQNDALDCRWIGD